MNFKHGARVIVQSSHERGVELRLDAKGLHASLDLPPMTEVGLVKKIHELRWRLAMQMCDVLLKLGLCYLVAPNTRTHPLPDPENCPVCWVFRIEDPQWVLLKATNRILAEVLPDWPEPVPQRFTKSPP